jgi:mono/diheme cytochrome c family protein
MASRYRERGVRFIGINSNQHDSMDDIRRFQENLKIGFPLVKDYDNQVADQLGAERTPEVFVIDRQLRIRYRGRVDDQYEPGVARAQVENAFLQDALEQVLSGQKVSVPSTAAVGCLIGRQKVPSPAANVTYANQISRLFQKHCVECHRAGEIGPFDLQSYEEARGWAEMIVEVVENGRMPPWHATKEHGQFRNERFLTAGEKQLFRDWLEQGTPYGDASELPGRREFIPGWRLPREPDQVVAMNERAYLVPPEDTVEYQYFVVDPGFSEDKWVTAAEVVPGNRSVVHHSIVFVRPPDGRPLRGIGWLTAYVPGQGAPMYRPTHARFIPAGSKLVFQQHYTPTGTAQEDVTQVGLIFGQPAEITHEIFTLAALEHEFEIPAEDGSHLVHARLHNIPRGGELIGFAPHMHYRGRSFQLFSQSGDVRQQLIDIPRYDFNWQHFYQFEKPLSLESVERIEMEFGFDNSSQNPFNPDPLQNVTWGDQTWEEMAVAFFEVAQPRDTEHQHTASTDQRSQSTSRATAAFVDDYFQRFDSNRDGMLTRDELPVAVKHFRFRRYDADGDNMITRDELMAAADVKRNSP